MHYNILQYFHKETTAFSLLERLLSVFLAEVLQGHKRVAQCHAWSGVGHHSFDALLRFASLAMNVAIFAIAFMPVRAGLGTLECGIHRFAAGGAQARGVLSVLGGIVVRRAVDAPNSLERLTIFVYACFSFHTPTIPHTAYKACHFKSGHVKAGPPLGGEGPPLFIASMPSSRDV